MYPRLLVFRDALTWMLSAWLADPITDPGARRQDGKIAFIKCDDCSDGVRRIIRSGTAGVRMSARSSLVAIGFPAAGAAMNFAATASVTAKRSPFDSILGTSLDHSTWPGRHVLPPTPGRRSVYTCLWEERP